jgi:hypothetical protein
MWKDQKCCYANDYHNGNIDDKEDIIFATEP